MAKVGTLTIRVEVEDGMSLDEVVAEIGEIADEIAENGVSHIVHFTRDFDRVMFDPAESFSDNPEEIGQMRFRRNA